MTTTTPQIPELPQSDSKASQMINATNAILVGIIALISFALSYSNLQQIAVTYGFDGTLSYAWPFLLDGALVVFSLSVVSAYLRSESTWRQWALVGLYTLVTVAFNILHAPDSPLAQVAPKGLVSLVVAMVPPVSLFFSFEMLMSQFKGQVVRQSKMMSIHKLTALLEKLQAEFATLQTNFTDLTDSVKLVNTELGTKRKEVDTLTLQLKQLTLQLDEKGLQLEQLTLQLDEKQALLEKAKKGIETAQKVSNNGQMNTEKRGSVNLDPKSKEDRCKLILQICTQNIDTSVNDLVKLTGVSRTTVYSDLRELEGQGLISKQDGNIVVTAKLNGGAK